MATLREHIAGNWSEYRIEYRIHATRRMFQRDISQTEVEIILAHGDIIEAYGDDFPLPSYLLCGRSDANRPLHIVAAINARERYIVVITTYEPEAALWEENFTRRKR